VVADNAVKFCSKVLCTKVHILIQKDPI